VMKFSLPSRGADCQMAEANHSNCIEQVVFH
jgi:hypothetical protein